MRQAEGRVARCKCFLCSACLGAVPLWASKATPAARLREVSRGSLGDTIYNSNLAALSG